MKKLNHREKNKKKLYIACSIVVLFVVCLSVVYAALSANLTINGGAEVKASSWKIGLTSGDSPVVNGDATYTVPSVEGSTIYDYTVGLTKPGDSVNFTIYIDNRGNLDAEILSIVNSTPTCTSSTNNTADAELVCNNLEISLTYSGGSTIKIGDVVNTYDEYCTNGSTTSYHSAVLNLKVGLKSSMTEVPSSSISVSNLKHEIIFGQTNKSCTINESCFVAGTKVLTEDGYKNIEDIQAGEYVYAMDLDTNNMELKKVMKKINSHALEIFEITVNNKVIETTNKHPFYVVDKGWIKAADLVVGDRLSSLEVDDTTIIKIEKKTFEELIPVYNMEVEGLHNYLITDNNFLVHNAATQGEEEV